LTTVQKIIGDAHDQAWRMLLEKIKTIVIMRAHIENALGEVQNKEGYVAVQIKCAIAAENEVGQ
jgi:hypothetical protein